MPLSPGQHQRVLASIASGRLRLDAPTTMYAGYGAGHTCIGCDEVIDATQVEYEAVFQDGAAYRLHLGCASLLDAERRRAQRSRRAQEQAPATFDKARQVSKESAQARDRADVLAREAETIREESRRVKRGEEPESTASTPSPHAT